ncbi:hypothetical protein F4818DRAFT_440732 [Hypoxylon cercidicola]|nr:hypothetical protein F4818DRAFT_440732 [Hypoxylon cercidicola]
MVREHQDTERPGTPCSRPSSNTNSSSHGHNRSISESGSVSKGVFSKVLGSFRHKLHDEKHKSEELAKQQQQGDDWIANYKITHRPDRPRVDKRGTKERSNLEYAAEIHRMQERSQRHYELNHPGSRSMDRSIPPPTPPLPPQQIVQASMPNFSYSPGSPRYNMGSPPPLPSSPPTPYDKMEWPPPGDRAPMKGHSRAPSEPLSPAMTIQVYRASLVDRSTSLPLSTDHDRDHGHGHDQGPLLSRKVYDPNETYAKRAMRDSGYARKASWTSSTDSQTVHRKAPSTNLHSTAAISNLPLTSSPTSYASPAAPKPPRRAVRSVDAPRAFPLSPSSYRKPFPEPKTCVMPGCAAPLLSDLDREQNVCAPCRKEYRLSTFDAAATSTNPQPGAPAASDLATLRALVGGGDNNNNNNNSKTRTTALDRAAPARLVNKISSNFRADPFKLQPAPPGRKRRQRHPRISAEDKTGGAAARHHQQPVSAWSASTASGSGSGSQHVAYQDRRLFSASRKTSDAQPTPTPASGGGAAAALYDAYLTESPRSSGSGSGSWTSESPPRSGSDNSDAASLSPLSEPLDDADLRVAPLAPVACRAGETKTETAESENGQDDSACRPLHVAPLAPLAPRKAGAGGVRVLPPPPPAQRRSRSRSRPSRDTVLYQAIDDIIDSYTQTDVELEAAESERRRADAVASYYEREPEAVEMRKKGFF